MGDNKYGQLGLGNNINQNLPQLVNFFQNKIIKQIINSDHHTFAIIDDGSIYSWGCNRHGELGLGNIIGQNHPQLVDFFHDKIVDKIICYNYLTFAIINDGHLYSWSDNEYGRLGLGDYNDQNSPQSVDFFQDKIVQDIVCRYDCTFANVNNGELYSWGDNRYGQLGLGNDHDQNGPQLVDFFRDKIISKIICGCNHIFVVVDDGSVYSWGKNDHGQLGLNNNIHQNLPQLVDFFQNKIVNDIVCNYGCMFAIVDNDALYSCGYNIGGQLGLGDNLNQYSPQLVDFFQDKKISKIIYGNDHVFVIINDGSIYSWAIIIIVHN